MSFPVEPRTRANQLLASDPARSAWVSANAGAGKTYVLTQRVVRLLLGGAAPSRILCLTFTKAAAANMAERVFKLLREWTRLDDDRLAKRLAETTGAPSDAATLLRARTLFARAIETPGGLKIQTIHAFCEALLHRFPFEANVPASFTVAEALQESELLRAATDDALAKAQGDLTLRDAVATLTLALARDHLHRLLRDAVARRGEIAALLEEFGSPRAYGDALARRMGVDPRETVAQIEREMLTGAPPIAEWPSLAARLSAGSKNDRNVADDIREAVGAAADEQRLASWLAALLKTNGERRQRIVTDGLKRADPALADALDREALRLEALVARRRAVALIDRTVALFTVAREILAAYARRKAQAGVLDFADLIARASLLLDRAPGAWVMYKLDQGVDHILIDEAQDTSPAQWRIVLKLADEFFAGAARPGPLRTLFAVGDEKQSIFSFQGAAPHMFDETKRAIARRFPDEDRERRFASVPLNLSFRSTPGVLEAVDKVFAVEANRRGLSSSDHAAPTHESWKRELPGRVEIWPMIMPPDAPSADDGSDWTAGAVAAATAPAETLAQRIADRVARFLAPDSPDRVHDEQRRPRRVRPGDIMILVRNRRSVFEATIRALKARDLPVAGADRIRLPEHIAVLDLVALGRAILSPADDLTLAALLKSPLFGLDDDDLMALAARRRGALSRALANADAPRHAAAAAQLATWRADAARLGPFAFYAKALGEDGGRSRFLERLGPEAGDVLDEFMALALEHENTAASSLPLFLAAIEAGAVEIKREGEADDVVRVMTAHAAKGLEAKIVFLPDSAAEPYEPALATRLQRLPRPEGPSGAAPFLLVTTRRDDDPPHAADAKKADREAAEDEHRRLLYVALTRAEEQLILASACGGKKPAPGCWARVVQSALEDEGRLEPSPAYWNAGETILRRDVGAPGPAQPEEDAAPPPGPAPDWLFRPAPDEVAPTRLAPSASAPSVAGEGGRLARARGRRLHSWIEQLAVLPAERRARAAEAASGADAELARQALALMQIPALATVFGPGSRAEVALQGTLDDGTIVSGRVDRLAVTEREAIVVDFKSGAGEDAAAYAAQMQLYRRLLAPLYPGRALRTVLVFAASGRVVDVP